MSQVIVAIVVVARLSLLELSGRFALAILGMGLSAILCYVIPFWWLLSKEEPLTSSQLAQRCPSKQWATGVPMFVAIGMCVVGVIMFMLSQHAYLVQHHVRHSLVMAFFFFPTFLVGSYGFVGIIEVIGSVSIFIPLGRSGQPGRERYFVSPKVRMVGGYRILVAALVVASFYFLVRWEAAL